MANVGLTETCRCLKRRGEERTEQREQDGWVVTRLPARAELTLVDPFSRTEMEGTLQDREQGQGQSVSKSSHAGKQRLSFSAPLYRRKASCDENFGTR